MDGMLGGMAVLGVVAALVLIAAIGGAVYLALRLARPTTDRESAHEQLERRLASGEIDVDDYHERQAALRTTAGSARRR